MNGKVVDFDRDGLGWIELDDGTRLRFSFSAVRNLESHQVMGTRVRVLATAVGYKGVVKATSVEPEESTDKMREAAAKAAARVPWSAIAKRFPRWSDADAVTIVPTLACGEPEPPPLTFAAWTDEIVRTAPIVVPLHVPRLAHAIDAAPDVAFSHGRTAFLAEPGWPTCAKCEQTFEMCIELPEHVLEPWVGKRGSLVAMYCFGCNEPYVRFVAPKVRVLDATRTESKSSEPHKATQRVDVGEPRRAIPGSMWYRYRSAVVAETASAHVFGFDADNADVAEEFERWSAAYGSSELDTLLGGAPAWDQADDTPSCAHGSMRQLLEYNGGQFLDGALHVFVCTSGCTDVRAVAEH